MHMMKLRNTILPDVFLPIKLGEVLKSECRNSNNWACAKVCDLAVIP